MYHNNYDNLNDDFKVLKCIKCGYQHNLVQFAIKIIYNSKIKKKSRSYNRNKISSLYIPVCMRCSLEFQAWKRFKRNFYHSIIKNIICFLIIFPLIWSIYHDFWFRLIILMLFASIFFIGGFKLFLKLKKMEYNPKRYMNFDKEGNFNVKPEQSEDWKIYIEWLKETFYENVYLKMNCASPLLNSQRSTIINCTYCGAKVMKKDIKCFKCGKLLPLI